MAAAGALPILREASLTDGTSRGVVTSSPDGNPALADGMFTGDDTMRILIAVLFLAAAVTLPGTPADAEEPVQTCTGRVTAVVDNGEYFGKPVRLLGVKSRKDCSFFYTERFSTDARRILRTCPIGSSCRVKARLSGGDGGIATIISVTRIK